MSNSSAARRRFVVLISGRGSNMQQIITEARAGDWPADFVRVISNEPGAQGLEWAGKHGIGTAALSHRDFDSRESFDAHLADVIEQSKPDYVLLAGFMRILSPAFVARFKNRLINIHPSLLPAFTGLHTHERALSAGVGWHGCTVHVVTDELDHGPIIAQAAVSVKPDDCARALAARVLQAEHVLYPRVVKWLAHGQVQIESTGHVLVDATEQRHLWIDS